MLLLVAGDDAATSPEVADRFAGQLEAAGVVFERQVYEGHRTRSSTAATPSGRTPAPTRGSASCPSPPGTPPPPEPPADPAPSGHPARGERVGDRMVPPSSRHPAAAAQQVAPAPRPQGVPVSGTSYDLVILGGGSGGYAAALRAAELGLTVALIEKDKLGGTCLHRGCIPTKALLHAAEVADDAREESEKFGIRSTFEGIDMPGVNTYKDGVVGRLYKGLQGLVKSRGDHLVEGAGRLVAPNTVEVAGQRYDGEQTSCSPPAPTPRRCPASRSAAGSSPATRRSSSTSCRSASIVLGGGVIGVEFASVWRSFGAEVTIVEALPAPRAERGRARQQGARAGVPQARHQLQDRRAVRRRHPERHRRHGTLENGETIEADLLLVAVGRGPDTAGLGLRGGRRHGRPRLRAHRRAAAHQRRRRLCRRRHRPRPAARAPRLRPGHLRGRGDRRPGPRAHRRRPASRGSPTASPRCASVGLTEAQAVERYGDDKVESYEYNLGGNGKSQILGTAGFVKVVRETDGPVVGIHMVGSRVGELIGEAQLIVNWEAYPEDVAPSSTPTRPRTRRSARPSSPWPASRCTPTLTRARPTRTPKTKETLMSARSRCPQLGESRHRGHGHPLAQEGRRHRRGRRAAAGGLDRQGRHRDPLPRRRHAARDQRRTRTRSSRSAPSSPSSATASGPGGDAPRRPGAAAARGRAPARRSRRTCRAAAAAPAAPPATTPFRPAAPGRRPPQPALRRRHAGDAAGPRRVGHRGHRQPLAQVRRRHGRRGRAAGRGLDRQGRHRDPLAGRRHAAVHRRRRGPDGRRRHHAGDDRHLGRRRGTGGPGRTGTARSRSTCARTSAGGTSARRTSPACRRARCTSRACRRARSACPTPAPVSPRPRRRPLR